MKKILFAAALVTLSFTAALAQYRPDYGHRDPYHNEYDRGRNGDIEFLQRDARRQIEIGIQRGALTRREAHMLMRRFEGIEMKQRKFSHRGRLSARESRILRDDLEQLMADTHRMSRSRGDAWAREPRGRY